MQAALDKGRHDILDAKSVHDLVSILWVLDHGRLQDDEHAFGSRRITHAAAGAFQVRAQGVDRRLVKLGEELGGAGQQLHLLNMGICLHRDACTCNEPGVLRVDDEVLHRAVCHDLPDLRRRAWIELLETTNQRGAGLSFGALRRQLLPVVERDVAVDREAGRSQSQQRTRSVRVTLAGRAGLCAADRDDTEEQR